MNIDARKYREAKYHNRAVSKWTRKNTDKYYSITQIDRQFYHDFLKAHCANKEVLEYGCGCGSSAFFLVHNKAMVTGIDISELAVLEATKEANRRAVDMVTFKVMDAESTTFSNNQFDMVCGTGILHHLDLKLSYAELARVLKPSGIGIFIEPLGHNPIINLYRKLTPSMRTEDEHPMLISDLNLATSYFDKVNVRFFHLFTLLSIPFRKFGPFFTVLLKFLHLLDKLVFAIRPLQKYAWIVVLIIAEPRSPAKYETNGKEMWF